MNFRLSVICIILSLNFIITYAEGDGTQNRLLFSITSQNRARLGVINGSSHNLILEITNDAGDMFFKETIAGGRNYFELLDMSKMPDGAYQVKLTGQEKEISRDFIIKNHRVEIKKVAREIEPSFHVINNESLNVIFANPYGKKVKITFERNNDVIFEDDAIYDLQVNKKYSLRQLPKGIYLVKLYADDEEFSFPVTVN